MIAGATLRHLACLTDDVGIVEHARRGVPAPDLGYCTDDAGRALALACRMPDDPDAHRIARVSLRFLRRAHLRGGAFFLRWRDGWTSQRSDDACGRAVFGLGVARAASPWDDVAGDAADLLAVAAGFRSAHPRATAYAVLGAAAVVEVDPDDSGARALLRHGLHVLPRPAQDPAWRWPADRLTYANAVVPDALLAAAWALGQDAAVGDAVELLSWLADEESVGDRFSFTPTGGRGRDGPKPGFDQQPVEAAAMCAACARALAVTGDARWAADAERAVAWFAGRNDVGVPLLDPATGGCFDGLTADGVNRNEGAESAIALGEAAAIARRLRREAYAR